MHTRFLTLALCCCSGLGAAAQPGVARVVQLAVSVRDSAGDAVLLKPRQFRVYDRDHHGGNPLPLQVLRGANAPKTHLLILLPYGIADDHRRTAHKLKPLWKAGWLVNVVDALGWSSGYISSELELQARTQAPATAITAPQAESQLFGFVGQRVLFVFTPDQAALDRHALDQAIAQGAFLYRVGGNVWQQEVVTGYSPFNSPANGNPQNSNLGSNIIAVAPSYQRRRGPLTEESSLRHAVEDSLQDASGFYLLAVSVPPGCRQLGLQVLTEGRAGPHYRVNAQASDQGARPPGLAIMDE